MASLLCLHFMQRIHKNAKQNLSLSQSFCVLTTLPSGSVTCVQMPACIFKTSWSFIDKIYAIQFIFGYNWDTNIWMWNYAPHFVAKEHWIFVFCGREVGEEVIHILSVHKIMTTWMSKEHNLILIYVHLSYLEIVHILFVKHFIPAQNELENQY